MYLDDVLLETGGGIEGFFPPQSGVLFASFLFLDAWFLLATDWIFVAFCWKWSWWW